MKTSRLIMIGLISSLLIGTTSCKKEDKAGCTDSNADNYDSKADKNEGCRYRYASNIDIDNIPVKKSDGSNWDDSDGPDLRVEFGKSSNSGFDYSTSTYDNYVTGVATVTPSNNNIRFSDENWKYQLLDVDLLGSEVISSGTFNPLKSTTNNQVSETGTNGVTFKFKYTIQ